MTPVAEMFVNTVPGGIQVPNEQTDATPRPEQRPLRAGEASISSRVSQSLGG